MPHRVTTTLLLLLLIAMPLHAQKWIGAEKMLERLSDRLTGRIRDWEVKTPSNLQAFTARLPKLAPKEAARQWIALLDHYFAKKPDTQGDYTDTIEMYLKAIPPPSAWKELITALRTHKPLSPNRIQEERVLKILASVLEGDSRRAQSEVKAFQKEFPNSHVEQTLATFHADLEKNVPSVLKAQRSSEQEVLKKIEEQIRLTPHYDLSFDSPYQYPSLTEEAFYTKIFTTLEAEIRLDATCFYFPSAYKVVLNNIDRLPVAQWAIACTPHNIALYEALERKFPLEKKVSASRRLALGYYILSLGMAGRTQEAVTLLQQEGNGKTDSLFGQDFGSISHRSASLRTPAQSRVWVRLLRTVLQKDPSLHYWNTLFNFARNCHGMGALESLLRENRVNQSLSPEIRSKIEENLYTAYCANDHTEEAVALLKEVWARTHQSSKVSNLPPNALSTHCIEYLSRLGSLCRRPEWIVQALHYAQNTEADRLHPQAWIAPIKSLADMGRAIEAERFLWKRVNTLNQGELREADYLLYCLIHLYVRTKQDKIAFFLLDNARYWQVPDVRNFYDNSGIKFAIAEALVRTGKAKQAANLLEEALRSNMETLNREILDMSANIALLIRLKKEKTRPLLEGLLLLYPDMPPLLYGKALLLQQVGKHKEAERVALQALRYYQGVAELDSQEGVALCNLLAELATTRGDKKQAQIHKNRESALRLMAQAQEFALEGLVKREHECYRKAFSFAPDIASVRLAMAQLAEEEERLSEARQHYTALLEGELAFMNVRRSIYQIWKINGYPYILYTALPHYRSPIQSSYSLLYTQTQQKFVWELLKNKPRDPIALTFAALNMEEGEMAVSLLQRAAQKDPENVVIWQTLRKMPSLKLPEKTLFWLLKTAPPDSVYSIPDVVDLKSLWNTLESFQSLHLPEAQESLYTLSAARQRLESVQREHALEGNVKFSILPEKPMLRSVPLPREVFLQQKNIQNIIKLLRELRPKKV
jgi:tetratricopeptide (TPR) repeat protein